MSLDVSNLIKQCLPQSISKQTNVAFNSLNALQSNNSIFSDLAKQVNMDFGGENSQQSNNNILGGLLSQFNANFCGNNVMQANNNIGNAIPPATDTITGGDTSIDNMFSGILSQLNTNVGGNNVTQVNNNIGNAFPPGIDTTPGGDDTTPGTDTTPGGDDTTTIPDDGKGAWGDPHYHLKGENGNDIKFDHKGKDNHTYNVFKGDNFQVDGKYVPYAKDPDNPQVIGKARVKAGDDVITFDKKGAATLNDKKLKAGEYDLKDGTHVSYKNKQMRLDSPEKDSNIRLKAESSGITVDPAGEFTNPGGIIGKAVTENKKLTNAEANKFDVTDKRPIQ